MGDKYATRLGYWRDDCPAQTKTQRADSIADMAAELLVDAYRLLPDEIAKIVRDDMRKAQGFLGVVRDTLKELDPEWCDHCGRWTDDSFHKMYCEGDDLGADEHDVMRDALLSGVVVAGAPEPLPRGEVD
jgi:hypothetical protein